MQTTLTVAQSDGLLDVADYYDLGMLAGWAHSHWPPFRAGSILLALLFGIVAICLGFNYLARDSCFASAIQSLVLQWLGLVLVVAFGLGMFGKRSDYVVQCMQ